MIAVSLACPEIVPTPEPYNNESPKTQHPCPNEISKLATQQGPPDWGGYGYRPRGSVGY